MVLQPWFVLVASLRLVAAYADSRWQDWLVNFGHDSYRYPTWIAEQRNTCTCEVGEEDKVRQSRAVSRAVSCVDSASRLQIDWQGAHDLTWCVAMHYLLSHMPEFDLDFLPGAVSVDGDSMLDDNVAFALMAWNVSMLQPRPQLDVALPYLLPYASYHESRANWRPLFFAKYAHVAADPAATTSRIVLDRLIGRGTPLMNWTAYTWPSFGGKTHGNQYNLGPFSSGTAPPVIAPFDFAAYGYGSCTAWSTFLTSALKAVGIPARQVGSPCWNTAEFEGLARENSNVSFCWHGGVPNGERGGQYLNNHNWVEYWDNEAGDWGFVDVASSSLSQDTWFCSDFTKEGGCGCASNAGKAGRDHEIFAPTWSVSGTGGRAHGGTVLDASGLKLSSGEVVSPLVWSPRLKSARGRALKNVGLRLVNRTEFYRCRRASYGSLFM